MATAGLSKELECSICLNTYTDPVNLKCGHSFCQGCIDCALDTQEDSGVYSCPECRTQYSTRPALQRNIALRNIVENFLSTRPDHVKSAVFCTHCVDFPVPAVKSCLLCEVSLCDKHLRVHKKSPEHVLTDPTTSLEKRKCPIHEELLRYFCTEDATCICVSCSLAGEHRGHQVELLDEASEKKKEKLRNDLQELMTEREEAEKRVQSLQDQRRNVEEKAETITERVTALFRDFKRCLEVLEKRVLRKISKQVERMSLSYNDGIQRLEIKMNELSRKIHHIEELCNMTDPLTVLQESDTGDLCDAEEGDTQEEGDGEEEKSEEEEEDEDKETDDEQLHDGGDLNDYDDGNLDDQGGDLDVADISNILHAGLSDVIKKVNVCFYMQEPADILLNENSAYHFLDISHNMKAAQRSPINCRLERSERFQDAPQVLSGLNFSSGQHYWEVDVGRSRSWRVGMCYPSIDREGDQSVIGYNNKSWCLELVDGQYSVLHDSNKIPLPADVFIDTVRIYLDYGAGEIAFYALRNSVRHLHTFTATFTEPLHAAIYVGYSGCLEISGDKREM